MSKKYRNMIHLALNAITITIFAWLQMIIFVIVDNSFHTGMFITMYVVSLLWVPLLWWGIFPKIK